MLLGLGNNYRQNASQLFASAAADELQRNEFNKQAKAAKKTGIVSGAASGAMIGSSFGPPGIAIGALLGGLGGALF